MENQGVLVLLLGSNSGDRINILVNSISEIQQKLGEVILKSSVYKSKAWGFDGFDFLNQVVIINTEKSSLECLEITQEIEKKLGRSRKSIGGKYENRNIDIDILFHDHQIFRNEKLSIPHPRIQDRKFTLVPLNEIVPEFIHPQLNKSISCLLNECTDQNEVTKLNG